MIDECVHVVCRVLLPWVSLPCSSTTTTTTGTTGPSLSGNAGSGSGSGSGQLLSVPRLPPRQTDTLFHESCRREFREVLVKMKLYLDFSGGEGVGGGGRGRMMGVLVRRVRERVVEGYRGFLDVVLHGEEEEEEGMFMGVGVLGRMLDEVIEDVGVVYS